MNNNNIEKKESIGICPFCKKSVIFSGKFYMCQKYKAETSPCNFVIPANISGKSIPTTEIIKLINLETTKVMRFVNNNNKLYEARLYYDKVSQSVKFDFANKKKYIGKCNKCGDNVYITPDYVACSRYTNNDNPCNFIFARKFQNGNLSEKECKRVLSGKKTFSHTFAGKSGNEFKAKIFFDDNLQKLAYHPVIDILGNCPDCGANVCDCGQQMMCENYSDPDNPCHFKISLYWGGAELSDDDINSILRNEQTEKHNFLSKTGKKFSARLQYNKNTKKIEYIYDN